MSPQVVEQLSPQPFRQWCAWRLDPNGWDRPDAPAVADDEAVVRQLAFDMGIGDRRLRRWRNENQRLERIEVEEALHRADVGFWEVYPDVELRVPNANNPAGFGSKLSDEQVLELHAVHLSGASIRELSRRIYKAAGYASAESADYGIRKGFRRLGLPAIVRHQKELATLKRCGHPRAAGSPCKNPPTPGFDQCWTHRNLDIARQNVVRATEARLAA